MSHRQIRIFLTRKTKANTKNTARAKGIKALCKLITCAVIIGPRVEHGHNTGTRVIIFQRQERKANKASDCNGCQNSSVNISKVANNQKSSHNNQSRALIWLSQDKHQRHKRGNSKLFKELHLIYGLINKVLLSQVRDRNQNGNLCKLRRLERKRSN